MLAVVDMLGVDMMAAVAEPLFQGFNAKVEFKPAMLLDDLKKAMQKSSLAVRISQRH